jgi:hypothetical protein
MRLKKELVNDDRVAELKRELQTLKTSLDEAVEDVREVNRSLEEKPSEESTDKRKFRKKNQ